MGEHTDRPFGPATVTPADLLIMAGFKTQMQSTNV